MRTIKEYDQSFKQVVDRPDTWVRNIFIQIDNLSINDIPFKDQHIALEVSQWGLNSNNTWNRWTIGYIEPIFKKTLENQYSSFQFRSVNDRMIHKDIDQEILKTILKRGFDIITEIYEF